MRMRVGCGLITGSRVLGGKDGDNIEVCLVRWPGFEDIDIVGDEDKAIVVNPGDTGYASAFPNVCELLNEEVED